MQIEPNPRTLPSETFLIYMWMTWGWELKGTATTVEERDEKVKHYDAIPGGGQVVWRLFKADGPGVDRFGHKVEP